MFKTLEEDIQTIFAKDPVAEAIRFILREQDGVKERLRRLESSSGIAVSNNELVQVRKEIEREFNYGEGI